MHNSIQPDTQPVVQPKTLHCESSLTPLSIFTIGLVTALFFFALSLQPAQAQKVVKLKNGIELDGLTGQTSAFIEGMTSSSSIVTPVATIDDGLRKIYLNKYNIQNVTPGTIREESFEIDQFGVSTKTEPLGIGPILYTGPFNQFGRRQVKIMGPSEPVTIIQGITEISPRYCVLRTIESLPAFYTKLEMRISTRSIPREMLSRIMRHHINASSASDRLKIVSFYQQAERYLDAESELKAVIEDFPEIGEEKQRELRLMRQAWARQLVRKIKKRADLGQYNLAQRLIAAFPRKEVAGEILLEVSELKQKIEAQTIRQQKTLEQIERSVTQYKSAGDIEEAKLKYIDEFLTETKTELNDNNIGRFAAYLTLSADPNQTSDQNLALAISGWIMGSDGSTDNLEVALALWELRGYVVKYLQSNAEAIRVGLRAQIKQTEGGSSAKNLALLIKNLKPYKETKIQEGATKGLYHLEAPGLTKDKPYEYWIQLPPDYDPYRRYPCVVSLNAGRTSELQQIDWWAGSYNKKLEMRTGEAAQRGYIVIAPRWKEAAQAKYGYSIHEHAAVLNTLRDAFARFSIDTDRVFLSGHGMGGDAVWDIGLAHPDLWAGVIPITARADKYIARYWKNSRKVLPMYFLHGERDNELALANNQEWTRHLATRLYPTMVVVYRGRGREHFYEDIKNIYDWTDSITHRRQVGPEEFECTSMRPWDNFFWFVEVTKMRPNSVVLPDAWPQKNIHPTVVKGEIREKNTMFVKSTALETFVLLAPEFVDFTREVSINGRAGIVSPDPFYLLEDVRTRCDRQHPFWAKIDLSEKPWK